jgi:flagellar protein FlgJ
MNMKILGSTLQMLSSQSSQGVEKASRGGEQASKGVKKARKDDFDAQLRKAAQLYEAQFLREIVKGMRSTIPEGGLLPKSQGEKIFQAMLDEEYTDQWAARGGVGLADLIYDQLRGTHPAYKGVSKKGPHSTE